MRLKEITNCESNRVERKDIPISKLDSMLDYQRNICMTFVEEKSKNDVFDENEINEVKVSVRPDGSMKVCDGQHTIAILKRRGWTTAPCELRYGLSVREENDWFSTTNTKEQKQSSKRILTAKVNGTYEKNKEEQDFYNCLRALGLRLDIYGEKSDRDFKIGCAASLLNLYKEYVKADKKEQFIECLDIVRTCFNGDPISLQWGFLRGMFDFYETYYNKFSIKRFVRVFMYENARDLKKDAESDIRTKKTSLKYAKLFVEKYNYKLAKKKQLNMGNLYS